MDTELLEEVDTAVESTTPAADTPTEAPSLRDALGEAYDKVTATDPAIKVESAADPVAAAKAVVPGAETPPVVPPTDTIPERLKTKLGEKWATIDPTIKAEFREYESAIGRMADKYGKAAKEWDTIQRTVAPYQEMLRQENGNVHGAIANFFETARILRQGSPEQKQGILIAMSQAYKIPLPGAQPGSEAPAGGAANLSPEFLDRINRLEQRELTERAAAEHNARTQVDNDLNVFIGDAKNVYVKEPGLLNTMAALISAGKAEGLADSYEQAIWLHEGPRNAEIAKRAAANNAPRVAAAQRARQAGVSVNGNAPGTVKLDASKMSLRDTLSAAFDGELDQT